MLMRNGTSTKVERINVENKCHRRISILISIVSAATKLTVVVVVKYKHGRKHNRGNPHLSIHSQILCF